jgi:hypothetical protein
MAWLPLVRLMLFAFIGVFLAHAEEVQFSLSTSGSFSSGTPGDLSFAGIGTASQAGFTDTTSGGSLTLSDVGIFTLLKPKSSAPSHGADTYRDSFTLDLTFFGPTGINGQTTFDATLTGTVNTQQGSVLIDFGPAQTFTFSGEDSSGSFDLTVNDLALGIPHDGTLSVSQLLTGSISNATDPATAVPEPVSIVLLGTTMVLAAIMARRRRRIES